MVPKARQALERYGHQVVIGNMLKTRKETVTLITQQSQKVLSLTKDELDHDIEIESLIIPQLVQIHQNWISSGSTE